MLTSVPPPPALRLDPGQYSGFFEDAEFAEAQRLALLEAVWAACCGQQRFPRSPIAPAQAWIHVPTVRAAKALCMNRTKGQYMGRAACGRIRRCDQTPIE